MDRDEQPIPKRTCAARAGASRCHDAPQVGRLDGGALGAPPGSFSSQDHAALVPVRPPAPREHLVEGVDAAAPLGLTEQQQERRVDRAEPDQGRRRCGSRGRDGQHGSQRRGTSEDLGERVAPLPPSGLADNGPQLRDLAPDRASRSVSAVLFAVADEERLGLGIEPSARRSLRRIEVKERALGHHPPARAPLAAGRRPCRGR